MSKKSVIIFQLKEVIVCKDQKNSLGFFTWIRKDHYGLSTISVANGHDAWFLLWSSAVGRLDFHSFHPYILYFSLKVELCCLFSSFFDFPLLSLLFTYPVCHTLYVIFMLLSISTGALWFFFLQCAKRKWAVLAVTLIEKWLVRTSESMAVSYNMQR